MRRVDLISGIGIFLFSLLMIFVIIPSQTTMGAWRGLSPFFFPIFLMTCMAIVALLMVWQAAARPSNDEGVEPPLRQRQVAMFALVAAIITLACLAMEHFGVWVGGPGLIAAMMIFMGERKPLRIVLASVLPVAVVYALVTYVLRTGLP